MAGKCSDTARPRSNPPSAKDHHEIVPTDQDRDCGCGADSVVALPLAAQEDDSSESSGIAAPLNVSDVTGFLDTFFAERMAMTNVPGAVVVVVVVDGEILVTRGYGQADVEGGVPVDAETTVFRAGSVSKLFTATAVMQLVERGQLDLTASVSNYLTVFQVDNNYADPVTTGNLLTHTAGFDGRLAGNALNNPDDLVPLGDYLADNLPPRVLSPNDLLSQQFLTLSGAAISLEKVAWCETPFVQLVLIAFFLITFISTVIWPIRNLVKRLRNKTPNRTESERRTLTVTWVLATINLVVVVAVILRVLAENVFNPVPGYLTLLLVLPVLTTLLAVVQLAFAGLSWRDGYWSLPTRIRYTWTTIAALLFPGVRQLLESGRLEDMRRSHADRRWLIDDVTRLTPRLVPLPPQ